MHFLKVKNNSYSSNNSEVILKGVGLGNWLNLEHFMFGLPGTDTQIRDAIIEVYGSQNAEKFWNKYYKTYIDEKDIKYIAQYKMNHVRIPINYKLFVSDSFDNSIAIKEINRILPFLKKYNIWGIIDLHTAPGGQNPDWHSDNSTGKDNFWSDKKAIEDVVELWEKIANYYKDEPAIGGYELINEPCFFSEESSKSMMDFFKKCTKAIRGVDKNHIIFYSGNTYSRDFSMFKENLDENSSYTFHLYPFLQISDYLTVTNIDKRLEESLYNDISFEHLTKHLKKPLWCGETGHPHHLSDSYGVLVKFHSMLQQKNISWSIWTLKDCGEMGIIHAAKNGNWNSLCIKLSNNWNFWNTFIQDSALSAKQEKDEYNYYRWLAGESTKGNQIVKENLKNIPFESLMDALDDFLFDNCIFENKLSEFD